MISSDQPITDPLEDRLDSSSFASALAQAIESYSTARGGLVIGITGEWGSGKTSLVNLILHELLHREMSAASTAPKFFTDPGEFLSAEQLEEYRQHYKKVENHFKDLENDGKNIDFFSLATAKSQFAKHFTSPEEIDKAHRYFLLLRYCKQNPKVLVVHFSPWLMSNKESLAYAYLSELTRSVSSKLGNDVGQALAQYARRLAELAELSSSTIDKLTGLPIGSAISSIAAFFISKQESSPSTLEDTRQRLVSSLARLNDQKILVWIDDMDRLNAEELQQMFSLIRGVADLPNVVHLLTYDENILPLTLCPDNRSRGEHYLEKIVQFKRRLPPADNEMLFGLLFGNFEALLATNKLSLDEGLVSQLWYSVLRAYIHTPRAATRLRSGFELAFSALSESTDPYELLVLENLQLHDVRVYDWIRSNLSLLTGQDCSHEFSDKVNFTAQIEKLVSASSHSNAARESIRFLFPDRTGNFGSYQRNRTGPGHGLSTSRIEKSKYPDSNFRLSQNPSVIPRSDFVKLTESHLPEKAIGALLDSIELLPKEVQRERRVHLLDELSDFLGTSGNFSEAWLHALIKASSRIVNYFDHSTDVFMITNRERLSRVIVRGLEFVPIDERASYLITPIASANDITLLCDVVRMAIPDSNPDAGIDHSGIGLGIRQEEVRAKLVERIEVLAKDFSLWKQLNPRRIIWFWWAANRGGEVKAFLARCLEMSEFASRTLEMFISTMRSSSEGVLEHVNLREVNLLYPIEELEKKAVELLVAQNDEVRKIAKRFCEALARGRKSNA